MSGAAPLQTPLHAWHKDHGGRMVEFGGWSMPVQYKSIIPEHKAVRQRVGLFDISHMGRLQFEGPGTRDWLNHVTTNDVTRLVPGQIQYSLMATEQGGVIDDVLVYRTPPGEYAMVCNASNRLAVLAQLERYRGRFESRVIDGTFDRAMIAIQGPKALQLLEPLSKTSGQPLHEVPYYHCEAGALCGVDALFSRTGYTGEDGFEAILPS
jgi:aminomethyltransferase